LLILLRRNPVQLKVLPVARLREDAGSRLTFVRGEWQAGLPLGLFEDRNFAVPGSDRARWLSKWHSEREWLRASHRALYSNAVIGLSEHFRGSGEAARGFHLSRRELVAADLLVLAREHWNFNVRGFNPGGNHGSFFRASTHAVLMMAGGEAAGVRRGVLVDEPYDASSFVPTLLAMMGHCRLDVRGEPIQEAFDRTCDEALRIFKKISSASIQ
jgi:hypothetical protein